MNKLVFKYTRFMIIALALIFIALVAGMLPLGFLAMGFLILSLKDKMKSKTLRIATIVFCFAFYALKLLFWMYIVSHGHFFECPGCWLSETSYLRAYLPKVLVNTAVDFCLLIVVLKIGYLLFKRNKK